MRTCSRWWPGGVRLGLLLAVLSGCAAASTSSAEEAQPKHKDSRIKPPEVTYETRVVPATARPGDTVEYQVVVSVDEPWHIYAWADKQPDDGPRSTQFDLFDTGGLKPVVDREAKVVVWSPDDKPTRKKEPAFPNLDAVLFHQRKVVWSVQMTVPRDAKPGERTIQSQIYFQICNDQACKPPSYVTLPPATVTIVAGDGQAAVAPARFAPLSALLIGFVQDPAASGPSEPASAATPLERALPAIGSAIHPDPAAAAAGSSAAPSGDVARDAINQGPIWFILISAFNGLLAVMMPCVWPMIPITVNFFVKQGQKGGKTLGLALAYSGSIVAVYTILGLLLALVFGAQSQNKIAVNPWINLAFAVAFLVFGLSLLGLFELRLPTFLLNASAKGESRGGLLGVFFMALTLTITSFTCTAPLVGGLVVIAAQRSNFVYPILGLFVFSAVLALPFFLLALMPGRLAAMPRSGDWMNSVKIVGGLLEIGAALKFFNQFEVNLRGTSDVFCDAQVVLTGWVVIALVCGIYLLGLFRTNHDHENPQVGPVRLLLGLLMMCMGLYLAPALFGYPPKGQIYDTVVGILPPDAKSKFNGVDRVTEQVAARLNLPATLAGLLKQVPAAHDGGAKAAALDPEDLQELSPQEVRPDSKVPKVATQQARELVGGLSWRFSFEQGLERAKAKKMPVIIDFTGVNCANCRTMESKVIPDPAVVAELRNFVRVRLYTDFVPIDSITKDDRDDLGEDNLVFEQKLAGQTTSPLYVIVDTDGKVISQKPYDPDPANFVSFLQEGQARFRGKAGTVAQK
jgi:thiol:disulfide interchange protein DsbD